MACGGVLPGKRSEIPDNGSCMYNSVIRSLVNHPCGNLNEMFSLPNTAMEWIDLIVSTETWRRGWTMKYNIFCGIHNNNAAGFTRNNIEPGEPEWVRRFFEGAPPCKPLNDFLLRVARELRHPSNPSGWGGTIEFGAIQRILGNYNIRLAMTTLEWEPNPSDMIIPPTKDFGTESNPIVHVLFSGAHYDSYIWTAKRMFEVPGRGGYRRKSRKMRKNKHRSSRTRKV